MEVGRQPGALFPIVAETYPDFKTKLWVFLVQMPIHVFIPKCGWVGGMRITMGPKPHSLCVLICQGLKVKSSHSSIQAPFLENP